MLCKTDNSEVPPYVVQIPVGGWCPIPTATTVHSHTTINLSLKLTGIGTATTDSARLGINSTPTRLNRDVNVVIINSQNQQVVSAPGKVTFDSATGLYKGTTDLGDNFVTGSYLVKVRMDNTLWKTVPGIQNIVAGDLLNTPVSELISGDIKQDNEINLLDYTIMISCLQGSGADCQFGTANNETSFNIKVKEFFSYLGSRRQGD